MSGQPDGLSAEERAALYDAMRGWARDLCIDTETPIEVVERIVARREAAAAAVAVEKALGPVSELAEGWERHAQVLTPHGTSAVALRAAVARGEEAGR